MKILIIDEEFPFPPNSGKRQRSFSLTSELAKRHQVTYLAYGLSSDASAEGLRNAGITTLAVDPLNREKSGALFYGRLASNLFTQYPFIVSNHYSTRFQETLDNLLKRESFDVIVCEWTPYALFVKDHTDHKRVIVAHNVESDIWRRYYAEETNRAKRWYIGIQWHKVEAFEKECFHWVQGATAVSPEDARALSAYELPYNVGVVENGVDTEYFAPSNTPVKPNHLVFTGSMDWRPNQDAVTYFCESIWPLLRKEQPDLEISLVGRKPPEFVTALGKIQGVTVTGTVDDVRPYIAQAAVYVVPLRIGGGSRLKILEAASMKKTIVSTSIGAEGLEVTDGDNIVLADTPEGFAESVLKMLGNPEKREKIGASAKELVESRYRWQALGQKYSDYLEQVVNRT